jgi:hypothetical protein
MLTKLLQIIKSRWFIGIGCLLIGAAIILGIRFFTYKVPAIHYHANFALYINGQQEEFKGMQYYTEVNACMINNTVKQPSERVHMHDNVNNVVHVEDNSVTWGQFFTNLGWTLGPTFIASPDGTIYSENGNNKLNLVLNGQDYTDFGGLQNNIIKDKDKLLVSFGDESTSTLNQQYSAIPNTAQKYDTTKDPASCSGNHVTTMHDRLTNLL